MFRALGSRLDDALMMLAGVAAGLLALVIWAVWKGAKRWLM